MFVTAMIAKGFLRSTHFKKASSSRENGGFVIACKNINTYVIICFLVVVKGESAVIEEIVSVRLSAVIVLGA